MLFRIAAGILVGATLAAAQTSQGVQPREPFTLALTGDSIINQRLAVFKEPEFTRLFDIIRGADAAFTNLETLFHDYEMPSAHESGGTWMRTEPPILKDLVWAGFDLVSRANNHAGDFGPAGSAMTSKYVRDAGLVEAGVGNSLAEAREAKFLETPKARVALISAASTFPPHSRAGNSRGDMPARPGLNPLRFTTTYVITAERMADLKRVASELSGNPPAAGDTLNFGGRRYVAGAQPGTRTEPDKGDLEAIETLLRMPSDSYEQYSLDDDVAQPGDYLDARYDKDRRSFPADAEYWDSVPAVTRWDGSRFVELQLHPITLGYKTSRADRGRPKLASGADAARILEMVSARSKPFGATVTVKNGVGIVTP